MNLTKWLAKERYTSLLLIIFSLCLTSTAQADAHNKAAKPAPDFTLKSDSGSNIRLSEQRGKIVMINFWASWCGPCRQEMPYLEKLYKRYGKAGVVLLGINVDKDSKLADHFLKDLETTFPILYDPTGSVSKQYKVRAMPTTVIIDRDGNIRYTHRGYKPGYEDKYKKNIRELLKEK
ncbi:MAG: TlpA family protein disulfide reductase [Cellvibrionaceae bacterium]